MARIVKAGLAYVVPVFAAAFVLGAVRVTVIAPQIGPVPAVALEIPLVLALGWLVASPVLRHWPLSGPGRTLLALWSFALLMLLEGATALAFGRTPAQFLTAMTTPAGALGLMGQIAFALIPLVRQVRG